MFRANKYAKGVFAVKGLHHRLLFDSHELAIRHGSARAHAESLAGQRAFAKEIPFTQYANRRFLADLGYDGQLHFALLDIEDRVRHIALPEYDLLFRNRHGFPALANRRKKRAGVEIVVFPSRRSSTHLFLILTRLRLRPTSHVPVGVEDSVGRPKYGHGKHVRDMGRTRRLSVPRTGGPPTEPNVNLPHSVAEILKNHVTFQLESIDRLYLNVYVPALQEEGGVVRFFRSHRGQPIASSALMDPMTKSLVAATERFAQEHQVPLIQFEKGQRKDEVMAEQLRHFDQAEGVVFIGKAQEKTPVFGTEKRRNPETGQRYPWIVRSTAMVNHYYWYCVDRDFGPFFLKFCSYFPYTAKLCLNGHEYAQVSTAAGENPLPKL